MVNLHTLPSQRAKAQERTREADHPVVAGHDIRRRSAAQARLRHFAVAIPDRLPDLWRTQRRTVERHPDLSRADRRPARRQHPSRHRQGRLVGYGGRSGPADRHQSLLRDLLERRRRLHGLERAVLDQSADRPAVGPRLSVHHHSRHGARAGDADRSPRHRDAVLRRRRFDGRHAGAAMGVRLSAARVLRRCRSPARRGTRRRTSPSTRSAARR